MSSICISVEAAGYLALNSELLPHHVATREVLAGSVQSLLHDSNRLRSRLCKSNKLAEKLDFIHEMVSQWIEHGGLGRMDEDEGGEKLRWGGPSIKECARKPDSITVGRYGGDVGRAEV